MAELETRTIRKVMWRLLPFLMLCYVVAFIDRVKQDCVLTRRKPRPKPAANGDQPRLL